MKRHTFYLSLCLVFLFQPWLAAGEWESIFDGASLKGWNGDPAFWSVKDGAITGITTKDNPTKGNTFIIYTGHSEDKSPVELGDFTLTMDFRISGDGGNSGVQYRSFMRKDFNDGWRVGGYQFDISVSKTYTGTNYGERFRGGLGSLGKKTTITKTEIKETEKGPVEVPSKEVVTFADAGELKKLVRDAPEWNQIEIIAKGPHLIHKVNGQIMCEVIDLDEKNRRDKGLIAIQLHAGRPMMIQVKNIQLKKD